MYNLVIAKQLVLLAGAQFVPDLPLTGVFSGVVATAPPVSLVIHALIVSLITA